VLTSVVAGEYPGLKEEFETMNEKQKEPGSLPNNVLQLLIRKASVFYYGKKFFPSLIG